MLTVVLILFPFLAALLAAAMPTGKMARNVALGCASAEVGVFLPALLGYAPNVWFKIPWVSALGIDFHVGMDGVSMLMVLLTVALVPLIIATAKRKDFNSQFYALIMLMQGALIGVFTARDGFLFYIFWELALIPIWFICLVWGEEGRQRITMKFFIYTLLGSLFMLLGMIYLYLHTPGTHSFNWILLTQAHKTMSVTEQSFVFWAMFLAFAVKMPVFPFHTWQPDTYTNAPAQGTMLLSGIMSKMGVFGLMYWLLPMVPQGVAQWKDVAIILSIIGIVYGSVIAIQQRDLKRLAAYSSFAHIGLISAGVFAGSFTSLQGATMQMLAHGFNIVALFYIIDLIEQQTGTRRIDGLGGIAIADKPFAVLAFIIVLGSVAMPLTNAFVGEFMLLMGVFNYNAIAGVFAGTTIILGAIYMLKMYRGAFFGEATVVTQKNYLDGTAFFVLATLAAIVIIMGVCPKPFMDLSQTAIQDLLTTTF